MRIGYGVERAATVGEAGGVGGKRERNRQRYCVEPGAANAEPGTTWRLGVTLTNRSLWQGAAGARA
ncbi:MAG: hypothetical protein HDR09_18135 [Lachnospiraceae bacterium]|nr:hypothetical protein [Lachnospiraceae bacterium]